MSDTVLGRIDYTKVKSDEGANGPVMWEESLLGGGKRTVRRHVREGAASGKFGKVVGDCVTWCHCRSL